MSKIMNSIDTTTSMQKFITISLLIFTLGNPYAWAASLEELRASGTIGESATGYVIARDSSAQAQADSINTQRRVIYQQKAAAQGISADQVGKVYAQEIFNTVPAGTWIQINGQWTKK